MTQEQLKNLLSEIKTVNGVSDGLRAQILQMAAESITLSTLQSLLPNVQQRLQAKPSAHRKKVRGKSAKIGFKLTKKELKEIPTMYNKIFAYNDLIIPYRFHKGVYEAHYRGKGLDVFACAKDFNEMKRKFITKLTELEEKGVLPVSLRQQAEPPQPKVKGSTALFDDYVDQWLEIKKRRQSRPHTRSMKGCAGSIFWASSAVKR